MDDADKTPVPCGTISIAVTKRNSTVLDLVAKTAPEYSGVTIRCLPTLRSLEGLARSAARLYAQAIVEAWLSH